MTRFFATCPRTLEPWLIEEAQQLELPHAQVRHGGVAFDGDGRAAMRACLWLRCASRVLEILDEGPAPNERGLYERARSLPWHRFLSPERTFRVDATVANSRLTHSQFVALKAKDAIVDSLRDRFGARPSVSLDRPDVWIRLRLHRNTLTTALDLSGAPLHRRGARMDGGRAPLKENLAAAIIRATGWRGETPLYDPFCGSGTLGVEAAAVVMDRAPGLERPFAFTALPDYDPTAWRAMRDAAQERAEQAAGKAHAPIILSDNDPAQVRRARRHAQDAGVSSAIQRIDRLDALSFEPTEGAGLIVTNPPFGERMSEAEVGELLRAFGDRLKASATDSQLYLLTRHDHVRAIGLRPCRRIPLLNGDIDCRLLNIPLYTGRQTR